MRETKEQVVSRDYKIKSLEKEIYKLKYEKETLKKNESQVKEELERLKETKDVEINQLKASQIIQQQLVVEEYDKMKYDLKLNFQNHVNSLMNADL